MKENSKSTSSIMGSLPVSKLVIMMSAPLILSQLVKALYNTVDSYYISALGMQEMAAITLASSAQSVLTSFASGIAVGANSVISRRLGEKKAGAAKQAFFCGLLSAAVIFFFALLFGLFLSSWYYTVLGADSNVASLGDDYIFICFVLSFGLAFSTIFETLLQATGHSVSSMLVQGSCFFINLILDPILIFGWLGFPRMGVRGAAIATVAAQISGLILAFILNMIYNRDFLSSGKDKVPFSFKPFPDIFRVGLPCVALNLFVPFMTMGVNSILLEYSEKYVALFGVYWRIQLFFFQPLFGINNGVIPIISYNYGAKLYPRLKKTILSALSLALILSFAGLLGFQLFGEALLTLFHTESQLLPLGVRAFRIISATFPFAALSIVLSAIFQGFGDGMFGLVVSVIRQLFVIVFARLLVSFFGIEYIWFAYWGSETLGILFCLIYSMKKLPGLISPQKNAV